MKHNIKSEWVLANAGSGKTTRLSERVVALLLSNVPPEHIVCLTYTKAAASEMRERVLKRLRQLLLDDDATCAARIEALLKRPATAEDVAKARQLFARVLDSPSGGVVLTTIHGFCQTLLRRFPFEAGLAPQFRLLEDAAADPLQRQVINALLVDEDTNIAMADTEFLGALSCIVARGGEWRFHQLVTAIIGQQREWDRVWRAQSVTSLRGHLWRHLGLAPGATVQTITDAALAMLAPDDEALLREAMPMLMKNKSQIGQNLAMGLSTWLTSDMTVRAEQLPDFTKIFLTKEATPRQYLLNKKHHPPESAVAQVVDRMVMAMIAYQQQLEALACAEESFAVAVMARALLDRYRLQKAAYQVVDFDDQMRRALELCRAPDRMGWVMSKLDHRIDHLLLDEAQDNSLEQWQLAETLVEELMLDAGHHQGERPPRSVFVVGDEKQSIYRFQGAAPEQFAAYHARFSNLLAQSHSPLQDKNLPHSYRSTDAVITLVNALCALPEMATALVVHATTPEHQPTRGSQPGQVVLHPLLRMTPAPSLPPMTIPMNYTEHSHPTQQLADSISEQVADWLAEGRVLAKTGKPITAGDILILVRTRTRLVPTLIRSLERRGVAVAGLDRLRLADHLAVSDILALMRWLDHPGDDLALAQVLRSPVIGMSDAELCAAAYGRPASLWQQVDSPLLHALRGMRDLGPYDFLTQLLEVRGLRQAFARRFGNEVHEVLDELKAQAAAMPSALPLTLAHFEAWITSSTRELKRELDTQEQHQLRVMTVHGAKGLEAPVVILADAIRVPTTQKEQMFMTKSDTGVPLALLAMSPLAKRARGLEQAKQHKREEILAEHCRLLYVAATRACDELHVFASLGQEVAPASLSWYALIEKAMRASGAIEQEGALILTSGLTNEPPTMMDAVAVAQPLPHRATGSSASLPLPAWLTPIARETTHPPMQPPSSLPVMVADERRDEAYGAGLSGEQARARGVRIHRMLEAMHAGMTEPEIAALVALIAPDWSMREQADVTQGLAALYGAEAWMWQGERLAEVSISGDIAHEAGVIAVRGQIDLMRITDHEIMIIDYKTSPNIPASAADVSTAYILQLKRYRAVAQQIYATRAIRCAIVWTHAPRVMWMDEVVARTPWPTDDPMTDAMVVA